MKIDVEFIPHDQHRFTTIGYWSYKNDVLTIQISQEISWRNKVVTLFHELIEAGMCISRNITTEECDRFDEMFEQEYLAGLHWVEDEAGMDKRCPYRKGHMWGRRFERLAMWLLKGDWEREERECLDLLKGLRRL